VEDIIVARDDEPAKQILKGKLDDQFKMNGFGKLNYFFRIEVAYSKKDNFISQIKYVLDLLKQTCKIGCKTTEAPIE